MRRPTGRLIKDTVTIYRRLDQATNSRGEAAVAYPPTGVDVAASFQSLGDTGRRQDRSESGNRLGGRESWRIHMAATDLAATTLDTPYVRVGDRLEFNGQMYIARGHLIPQRRASDGTILSYSVDVDGQV